MPANSRTAPTEKHGIFAGLMILICLVPWPHGGELDWEYLPFISGIFILLAAFLVSSRASIATMQTSLKEVKLPLMLLASWVIYTFLQATPLPSWLVNILSPNAVDATTTSFTQTPVASRTEWSPLSIAQLPTLMEALKYASYMGVLILSLSLLHTERRIIAAAQVMFATSVLMAIYSLVNSYTNGAFSLLEQIPPWTSGWSRAHGTFSYQNHYAAFLLLTIPLGFGLMYQDLHHSRYLDHKRTALSALNIVLSPNAVYVFGTLLMLTALLKTLSRGGTIVLAASVLITAIVTLFTMRSDRRHIPKVMSTTAAVLLLVPFLVMSGIADSLISRYSSRGVDLMERYRYYEASFGVIRDFPLTGSGAGTFPAIHHKYKAAHMSDTSGMTKRVHNDYLELLCTQGGVGFLLAGAATLILCGKLLVAMKAENTRLYGIRIACFCGVMSLLLHSAIEFNFQLPVNSLYFYSLLAMGISSRSAERVAGSHGNFTNQ